MTPQPDYAKADSALFTGVALVQRTNERVATWGTLIAAGLALATVIFTAGDASQRLSNHGERLGSIEGRVTKIEGDVGDMRVVLATLNAKMDDVQQTVHLTAGTPVPRDPHR